MLPDVVPLGPAEAAVAEPCWRHEARWPSNLVPTSGVIPSTLFKYFVTSLVHSLNPAMYLLSTDGSLAMATAMADRHSSTLVVCLFTSMIAAGAGIVV